MRRDPIAKGRLQALVGVDEQAPRPRQASLQASQMHPIMAEH